jgi:uncharacterized protein with NRDE domain
MCILLTTNANVDYPFILVSNRDEYFKRLTKPVHSHQYNGQRIISPLDMARQDHGTWIALNPVNKKFSILVNFREGIKDTVNPISRGVLPLDYVTSVNSTTKSQYLNELILKYRDENLLSKIGGFNLMFGDLVNNRFDIISNKNDSDFKIFSEVPEYHGLSNSSFDEPWDKVKLGVKKLQSLTGSYNSNMSRSKDSLINDLFGLLSHDSMGNITSDYEANFENIKNSIFVPPLLVRGYNRNNALAGKYYGTRTQTVILVDKNHHLTYIEKNLHSTDDLNEAPKIKRFKLDLNDSNLHESSTSNEYEKAKENLTNYI